jgi:hypothetical protein
MHNKTRRRNTRISTKALTIPQLKHAFDYIEQYASAKPSIPDFQKEWKKVFNRPIQKEHAESYLKFAGTKPLRRFRGGGGPGVYAGQGMLPGAVTDSGLRPYGAFQEYVSSGFEVGVPAMSNQVMCEQGIVGPQGPLPGGVLSGGGSGGSSKRRKTLRRIRGGQFPQSTNPTSILQDISTAWKGLPLPASPSPIDNPYLK